MKERKAFQELDSHIFLEEIRRIALERASELLHMKNLRACKSLTNNEKK